LPLRLKGQRTNHSQDEAIEFDYKIDEDDPETLASEMVSSGYFSCIIFSFKIHKNCTFFINNKFYIFSQELFLSLVKPKFLRYDFLLKFDDNFKSQFSFSFNSLTDVPL